MDILIKGPGEVTVCLVDRAGKTMLRETLRVFGSQTVSARRPIELELATSKGKMLVSPVLVFRGDQQTVTFDGKEPATFTRHRCKEIGSSDKEAEAAARGEIHTCRAMRRPAAASPLSRDRKNHLYGPIAAAESSQIRH